MSKTKEEEEHYTEGKRQRERERGVHCWGERQDILVLDGNRVDPRFGTGIIMYTCVYIDGAREIRGRVCSKGGF